jgi:2-oxoglutarate ferredoxin oxidoreductase subunit beta
MAIRKRGFGVVEVITHCPTQYGKKNKLGGPVEMLRWQKEAAVRVEKAGEMSEEELRDKFTIGVLVDRDLPIYIREYRKVREAAGAKLEEREGEKRARHASGS